MYSVSQVAQPDFNHSWHEAVALVQEVASQLDAEASVPAPEDLLLDEDGTLIFGFANEAPDKPVTSLGRLLKLLLDGTTAPGGLRDLAEENAGEDPAHTTVPGFCRALSFYERPNRANDLLAIAGRLKAVRVRRDADYEVERLREKFGPPPEPEQMEMSAQSTPDPLSAEEAHLQSLRSQLSKPAEPWRLNWRIARRHQRIAVAGGAFVALVIFIAGFAASGGGSLLRGERGSSDAIASGAAPGADAQAVGTSAATSPEAAVLPDPPTIPEMQPPGDLRIAPAGGVEKPRASDAGRPAGHRPADAVAVTPGPIIRPSSSKRGPVPPTESVFPVPGELPRSPAGMSEGGGSERFVDLSAAPPPARTPDPVRAAGAIYSSADADVTPPRLIRPQLPSEPTPGATTGYLDILVNEQGTVELLKLVSPTGHYHDKMLLPAAKAWRFRPAVLDGRPVKYRVLIPITIPEKK